MSTAILDAGSDAPFRADLRKPLYNLSASSVSAAGFRFAAPLARNPRRKPPLQGARPRCCGNSTIFCVDKPSVHDMLCPSVPVAPRSEEHTSELQSLMSISYAVFCLKKKNTQQQHEHT